MKRVKKIFSIIVMILIILLLCLNIYNIISLKVLKKDLATINGYGILEVVSGSMEPTIHVGDMIVIDTNTKDYQIKDIITFYDDDGSFITHRIVSIEDNQVITQGDNNNSEDKPITIDKIVGKYQCTLNLVGKLINLLRMPLSMVVILIIGIMICAYISVDEEEKLSKKAIELFNIKASQKELIKLNKSKLRNKKRKKRKRKNKKRNR